MLVLWLIARRRVTQKVIAGVYQGVTTVELDVGVYPARPLCIAQHSIVEPRIRDRCIPHHETSRLCRARCAYRYLQPAQGDHQELFAGHQRFV